MIDRPRIIEVIVAVLSLIAGLVLLTHAVAHAAEPVPLRIGCQSTARS